MNVLDRYLIRVVVIGGLSSAAAFALLILVFGFIDEVGKVSSNYSIWQALGFVLMTTPGYLYDFYPVAVLVGGLLGLGALAAHSELTVMRASGMSLMRLARPVLTGGVILALLGMLMGETIGAWGQERANQMRAEAKGRDVSFNLKSGLWLRNDNRFINVRRALVGGRLNHVRVYEVDGKGLPVREIVASHAQSEGGDQWTLYGVRESTLKGQRVVVAHHDRVKHFRLFSRKVLGIAVLKPRHMNIVQLWQYIAHLQENRLDATTYQVAFWGRIFAPISVLVMLLVTLPFVFANQRGGGAGRWLFIAIILGVFYLTLVRIVTAMAPVYGVPPFLSALGPPLLFAIAGIWALRRLRPVRAGSGSVA